MLKYAQNSHGALIYKRNGLVLTAHAWGTDGLRIRIRKEGVEQTSDWALDIPQPQEGNIAIKEGVAAIINGHICMEITDTRIQHGFLSFYSEFDGQRRCVLREQDWKVVAHNPGTHTLYPVGDGLYRAQLTFESRDGERLYGMGQNASDHLNLKGRTVDLYQRHVKAPIPFIVSSEGYGFLWNNPALGLAEFTNDFTRWTADACKQIDFYVTVGQNYGDILSHYADVTGHAPAFPEWAGGLWQCKLRYKSQDEILSVVREYVRRKLPLSVIVIDYLHWKHLGDWKLDPEFWPDPDAMVEECRKAGIRIMVSPWILSEQDSVHHEYMKEHGLFTGWVGEGDGLVDFDGKMADQIDPTNPETVEYQWKQWKESYVDHGITTFWLDPCDEFHRIDEYDKVTFHIGPAKECHSAFVIAHQKNTFEALNRLGEHDVISICRNAWAGSQRWGACPAPHDIMSSFEHMRQYLIAGLNTMMSGIMWWNCDIGGFITLDNSSPNFHELMIRWFQYGVFMPVFRTHGCRDNNEPWTIGGDSYEYIRQSILLRERLRPYLMEQMALASDKGIPPMRPLFFDFADDLESYNVEDAFLFGPDIYVAPVMEYKARSRQVYLPKGCVWMNAWTGKEYVGGTTLVADAPLSHIPVFIRKQSAHLCSLFKEEV